MDDDGYECPWDPEDDDLYIMQSAREGDYTLLIEALRSGAWVVALRDGELMETPWRRDLLIEILEGVRRPKHRQPRTIKDLRRKADIYRRVRELIDDGWKLSAADAKVAEELGVDPRTVNEIRRLVDSGTRVLV